MDLGERLAARWRHCHRERAERRQRDQGRSKCVSTHRNLPPERACLRTLSCAAPRKKAPVDERVNPSSYDDERSPRNAHPFVNVSAAPSAASDGQYASLSSTPESQLHSYEPNLTTVVRPRRGCNVNERARCIGAARPDLDDLSARARLARVMSLQNQLSSHRAASSTHRCISQASRVPASFIAARAQRRLSSAKDDRAGGFEGRLQRR